MAGHGRRPGVVGGKRKAPGPETAVLGREIASAAFEVLDRVPGIDPEHAGCCGHELRKPDGALGRDRAHAPAGFLVDQPQEEGRGNAVALGSCDSGSAQALWARGCRFSLTIAREPRMRVGRNVGPGIDAVDRDKARAVELQDIGLGRDEETADRGDARRARERSNRSRA